MSRRLLSLDVGRGVAATAVILYHVARHVDKAVGASDLKRLFAFGHSGVDFFFVLSGFIICFIHGDDIGRSDRVHNYMRRRFTRVLPTYWIALLLVILIASGAGKPFPPASAVIWSALLLPSRHDPLLNVAWTLQYEVLFYVLFGMLIVRLRFGQAVIGIWAALVVACFAGFLSSERPYDAYNIEFFLGMGAAFWLQRRFVPRPVAVLVWGIVLFTTVALAEDTGLLNGYLPGARIVYGIPAVLIVLGAAEADRRGLIAVPDWLRALGDGSYSLYLFQFIFIGVAWKLCAIAGIAAAVPPAASFVVLSGAAIAGGLLMSRLVEKPLIRFLRYGRVSHDVPKVHDLLSAPLSVRRAGSAVATDALRGTRCAVPPTPAPPPLPPPAGSAR